MEPGEEPAAAALREVQEETGLVAEIRAPLGDTSYFYVWDGERISKRVTFFLMDAVGGDLSLHDHEMEEVRFFPIREAIRVTDYRTEREIIERAAASLGAEPSPGGA